MSGQLKGIVLKCVGGFYSVEAADAVYTCRARGVFRKKGISPLAGDHVLITPDADMTGSLDEVLERRNSLIRPPVANLDLLLMVSSVRDPLPNTLVLDKMIAIAESKGIEPVLIFNKTDLASADDLAEVYRRAGFQVFALSALHDDLSSLRELLRGKVSALTGNSGVGKSSLLNALEGLMLETGGISYKLGRGRHTTRETALYPLKQGGYIVDTPGFSSLDMERVEWIRKEELAGCFREFAPYLGQCRFTSCSHVRENGCAVLEAVKAGKIAFSRHESYAAIYQDVKNIREWERK